MTTLGDLMVKRNRTLDPTRFPDEEFELYSIPAHDRGGPEVLRGAEIKSSKQIVQPGDVMISKIIPHIRRARVVGEPNGRRQIASGEWIVFRGADDFEPGYLRHLLVSDGIHREFMKTVAGVGGSLVRARTQQVKSITVRLPGREEQRRVTSILDHAIELQTRWRQVLDRLEDLTQSTFHDMFGEPASWPSRWQMGSVGEMAESVQYGTSARAAGAGRFPILRMGNVTDHGRLDVEDLKYIDLADKDISKYTVRRGDLLFNRTNSKEKVGKACVVRSDETFAIAGYLVRARFKPEHSAEFVCAYLTSRHGAAVRRRIAKASVNQANINATQLRGISIAHPPAALQHEFAKKVEEIEAQRLAAQQTCATHDELFASLQYRAFRGEL